MGKRWAVDGCKSQCASERKRMKLFGMRGISLFSTPKSLSQLEKWNDALSGNTNKLSSTDSVGAKHFHHEDIETHYLTELADGSTHVRERGKPGLRANAIPLRLPNDPEWKTRLMRVYPMDWTTPKQTPTDIRSIVWLKTWKEQIGGKAGSGRAEVIRRVSNLSSSIQQRCSQGFIAVSATLWKLRGKSSGNAIHSGTLGSFAEIMTARNDRNIGTMCGYKMQSGNVS